MEKSTFILSWIGELDKEIYNLFHKIEQRNHSHKDIEELQQKTVLRNSLQTVFKLNE